MAEAARWKRDYGLNHRALDAAALRAEEPHLDQSLIGGLQWTDPVTVIDPLGRHLSEASFDTTVAGLKALLAWSSGFGPISVAGVEGTGAYQRDFDHLYDAVVWVQSDVDEAERRGIERDVASGVNGGRERATAFWHEWMAAEVPYLAEQRAWDRADLTVAGTHVVELADGEWAVADRTPGARRNA